MWCIASSSTFKDMPQGEGQANSTHSMTTRACMLCVQLTATKNSNTSSALPNYEAHEADLQGKCCSHLKDRSESASAHM
jgi:hypothetical protein